MTAFRTHLLAAALSVVVVPMLPDAAVAQEAAIAALLQQANYWRQQSRPDRALQTLERVLTVDPNNLDALSAAAAAQAEAGNRDAADRYLARLRQLAPSDQRVSATSLSIRGATADQGAIAEARRLSQAGQQAQAVARYRQIFGGTVPPPNYAIEYYQSLAGTPDGFAEARDAMERLAERSPSDRRLSLAYAQILTYREGSRAEGVRRLQNLAQAPETAAPANAALRDALVWQGPDPAAVPAIQDYLRSNPNDPALQQQLEAARNPPQGPVDEVGAARVRGFDALNAGRVADAAAAFQSVLDQNPNDPDATGGMGLVRLRQGRNADARRLLTAAIAADPREGRGKWGRALDGANYVGEVTQARALIQRGNTDQAEALLLQATRREGGERADAEALLGDIELRRNDPVAAEQRFRAALARRPDLAPALAGLYDALQQQGRFAEAEQLAQRRGAAFAATAGAQRAEALRTEATRNPDPQASLALLRAAREADPNNPWIRLDLARQLARQGQGAEGRALVEELARGGNADAVYAAALYADEEGRSLDAARLVERIPDRIRTADQNRLLRRVRLRQQVAAAAEPAGYGRLDEARRQLLTLASRPDPSGDTPALVVEALTGLGDTAGAAEAARVAAAVNRNAPPSGRIAIANALLDAGLEQDAAQLTNQLTADSRLTADERRQLSGLRSGVAIRTSDKLNEQGNQAAAYDQLAPALVQDPQNVSANLALARLYQGAREPKEAQRIAETVLQRDPRNADARGGAVDAAIALRDWSRAEALLAEGRALMPNDPRITVLEARLARAGGDPRRARAALVLAAEQRRGQIGTDRGLGGYAATPAGAAPGLPGRADNPFRRTSLAGPGGGMATAYPVAQAGGYPAFGGNPAVAGSYGAVTASDPLLTEIGRELAAVQDEAATRITAGTTFRSRSGSSGLDKLIEFGGGGEISTALPGVGGRLALRAQVVSLDSGNLALDTGSLKRFGSNALTDAIAGQILLGAGISRETSAELPAALARSFRPRDTTATGISLGVGYTRDNFSVDVGSTPLGFREQNVVGGIEVAPALSDNLRLRLTAERRAMTDTMLSWAGMKDPVTGRTWGGVVRNTARGQLEYVVGNTGFYVGGGYSKLEGDGVADNTRIEAGAGVSQAIFRRPNEELVTGLDLTYQSYDKNLRMFSLGHGGYYSPQSYFGITVPLDYRARDGALSYRIGGTAGVAAWKEDRAPYFPIDADAQAYMEAAAAVDPAVTAFYPSQSKTTFNGGLRGDLEYQLTPTLRLGAALRYDRSPDWSEARGLLYARYRLDQ